MPHNTFTISKDGILFKILQIKMSNTFFIRLNYKALLFVLEKSITNLLQKKTPVFISYTYFQLLCLFLTQDYKFSRNRDNLKKKNKNIISRSFFYLILCDQTLWIIYLSILIMSLKQLYIICIIIFKEIYDFKIFCVIFP